MSPSPPFLEGELLMPALTVAIFLFALIFRRERRASALRRWATLCLLASLLLLFLRPTWRPAVLERTGGPLEAPLETLPAAPGVVRVEWPRQVELGQALVVRGEAAGLGGASRGAGGELRLEGPGGVEDSLAFEAGSEVTAFELRAAPRAAGLWLYRLVLELEGREPPVEQLVVETLGVEAVEPSPPELLVLEAAPSFESRFLARWLARRGGALVVRSKLSRERWRSDAYNRPRPPLEPLDAELLAELDAVIVLDDDVFEGGLAELGGGEREALRRAVAEGLGLLLAGEAAEGDALGLIAGLGVRPVGQLEEMPARPAWPGIEPLPALTVAARELEAPVPFEPWITDDAGRLLAVRRAAGAGRVIAALPGETYRWVLEGEGEAHARYWSRLIGGVARPAPGPAWGLPAEPLRVGEEVAIRLDSPEPRPWLRVLEEAGGGSPALELPLRQDLYEPGRWHTTFWPRRAGWHRLASQGGADRLVYVHPAGAWSSLRRAGDGPGPPVLGSPEELPRGWLYGLFLASLAALWVDERIRSTGDPDARNPPQDRLSLRPDPAPGPRPGRGDRR